MRKEHRLAPCENLAKQSGKPYCEKGGQGHLLLLRNGCEEDEKSPICWVGADLLKHRGPKTKRGDRLYQKAYFKGVEGGEKEEGETSGKGGTVRWGGSTPARKVTTLSSVGGNRTERSGAAGCNFLIKEQGECFGGDVRGL